MEYPVSFGAERYGQDAGAGNSSQRMGHQDQLRNQDRLQQGIHHRRRNETDACLPRRSEIRRHHQADTPWSGIFSATARSGRAMWLIVATHIRELRQTLPARVPGSI